MKTKSKSKSDNAVLAAVEEAIEEHNGHCCIAVHLNGEAALGKTAALIIDPEAARHLTFRVVPPEDFKRYPVGLFLEGSPS